MNSDIFHDESFGFGTAIASTIPFRCPFPTQNLAGYVFKIRKIIRQSFFKRTCENHLSFLHRSFSSTLMSLSISLIEKCINLRCVQPQSPPVTDGWFGDFQNHFLCKELKLNGCLGLKGSSSSKISKDLESIS